MMIGYTIDCVRPLPSLRAPIDEANLRALCVAKKSFNFHATTNMKMRSAHTHTYSSKAKNTRRKHILLFLPQSHLANPRV